jgi:hypothetical protein
LRLGNWWLQLLSRCRGKIAQAPKSTMLVDRRHKQSRATSTDNRTPISIDWLWNPVGKPCYSTNADNTSKRKLITGSKACSDLSKMKYLVEERQAKIHRGNHWQTLNDAFLRCDIELVEYLVDRSGKVLLSQQDHVGRPPLFYTCYRLEDPVKMVRYLISQGVDVSARVKDKMGKTVLHCAVQTRNPELVKLLIEHDKDLVHEVDKDNWTPLHWVSRMAYGPNPNSSSWNRRPISEKGVQETARLLLEHGSQDLEVLGKVGDRQWPPIKIASYHGMYDMLQDHLTPKSVKDAAQLLGNLGPHKPNLVVSHRCLCDGCYSVRFPNHTALDKHISQILSLT